MSENDVRIDIRGDAESFKRAAQESALALNKLESAGDKVSEATARQRAQAEKYLIELQKEAALLGQGEAVRRKLEVSMLDMTDAQRKQAMAVIDNIEAYKQSIAEQERMAVVAKRVGVSVGSAIATAALAFAKFTYEAIQAAKASDEIDAKLNAVLRATGHSAGVARSEIDALAESMKKTTKFDDDAIRNSAAVMLTYRNIQGSTFKEGIKLAADLSAVMGTDLQSATQLVAKALNEPEQALGALTRAGVQFSSGQRQMIKDLVDTGQHGKAQAIILDELKAKLGGTAEAMNTGTTKAANDLNNEWDDLLKAFGRTPAVQGTTVAALDAITASVRMLKNLLEDKSVDIPLWIKALPGIGAALSAYNAGLKQSEEAAARAAAGNTGYDAKEMGRARSVIEGNQEAQWLIEAQDKFRERYRSGTEKMAAELARAEVLFKNHPDELKKHIARIKEAYAQAVPKDELGALMNRLSGLDSNFNKELDTLYKAYANGKLGLDDYRKSVEALIDKQPFAVQLSKDAKKVLEDETKARKEVEKAREKMLDTVDKESDSIAKQLEQERDRVAAIGLSKEAIAELAAAKIELIAVEKEEYSTNLENASAVAGPFRDAYLQAAAAVRQQAKDLRDLAALKRDGAARQVLVDQMEEYDKQWTKTSDDISRGLTDALMRGFEGGKDAGRNFADALVNMFKTLILRPLIQPIVQSGASAVLDILGLPGRAAGGIGGVGGGGNLLSAGSTAWNALGGANSITGSAGAGMYGAFATSGVGQALGLSAVAPAGLMGPTASGFALGAASEGGAVLTSLGSSIGAAIPWVAVAVAVASILLKEGGGPKVEGNAYGVIGADGSFDSVTSGVAGTAPYGDGDWGRPGSQADAVRSVLAPFGQSVSDFVKGLGGDATGVGLHLGFNTDPQGDAPDNIGASVRNSAGEIVYRHGYDVERGGAPKALELEAQRVFVAGIKASDIDPIFKSIIDGVDLMTASADQLNQVLTDLKTVDVMMDYGTEESDPFAVYAKSAEEASRTLMGTWAMQGDAIRSLVDTYDGSVASTMKLANATAARYQTEIQLAQQFARVLESTGAMFENSIRTIKLDGLTNEEKYSFFDEEAKRYKDILSTVSDPASIAQYSEKLNNSIMSGWGLLSDEQKRATKDEYLALLSDADELSAKRIQAGQDQVREDRRELGEAIKTAIREAMAEAAEEIGNAVPSEIAVTVRVDGQATAEVGSMG